MIRVTTRHSETFDILSESIDPALSPYAESVKDYPSKINGFYARLGIQSAIWTTPEEEPPRYFESRKPIEYLLEIEESRIIAFVDELTWSPFLFDKLATYEFSRSPVSYEMTSILVVTPIRPVEVKEVRRYRRGKSGDCVLVARTPWVHPSLR